jgi:phosphoribosylpyrophosphate synthetase
MKTLIAHPQFDYLAEDLQDRNLGQFSLSKIQIDTISQRWPKIIFDNPTVIDGADVTYIWDYSRPDEFFEQYAIVQSLRDRFARKVRVICPYFPVGTMERIAKKWEVATARYFADLLWHFSPTQSSVQFRPFQKLDLQSIGINLEPHTVITHPGSENFRDQLFHGQSIFHEAHTLISEFDDGWPKLFIYDEKESIEHKNIVYIADLSDPRNLFREYAIMRSIIDYYADSLKIIIPKLPDFSQFSSEYVDVWRYLMDILSQLPAWRKKATEVYIYNPDWTVIPSRSSVNTITPFGGLDEKPSIHTFDIHALVERFIFDSYQANLELHTTLSLLDLPKDTVIAFPDDGAAKRFGESFPEYKDRIICIKVRGEGDKREITIKEWDPRDKDIIIVDDLIQTGGTIRETAIMLRSRGAKSVRAFAPHGVFPHDSHIELASVLDELIVTDSIPANIERAQSVTNMRVLSIAPLVERIIRGR